jgi:hypothetical protein
LSRSSFAQSIFDGLDFFGSRFLPAVAGLSAEPPFPLGLATAVVLEAVFDFGFLVHDDMTDSLGKRGLGKRNG